MILLLLSGAALAQTSPEEVARQLYGWALKADLKIRERLPEAERYLTPELYGLLHQAYNLDPNTGSFLDFDPWSNTQMGAEKYTVGAARLVGGLAKVPITVTILRGGTQKYTCVLRPAGDSWQVANLVYAPDFNLLSYLKDLTKAP